MQARLIQALMVEVGRRGLGRGLILPVLLGTLVGAVIYALVPIWFSFVSRNLPGLFTFHPLNVLLLAVLSALAAFLGTRWPVLGISAGLTILIPVAYASLRGFGPVRLEPTWDVHTVIAFGGLSGYPAMLGAAFATTAILSLGARCAIQPSELEPAIPTSRPGVEP